jgi:hypothetical protein
MRLRNSTDAKIDLDKFEWQPRSLDLYGWVFMDGHAPWSMSDPALDRVKMAPCPVCLDRPLRRNHYCLGCDRSGVDDLAAEGKIRFYAVAVGYCMDPDYPVDRPAYSPDESLDGGLKGGRVRVRRGVARSGKRAGTTGTTAPI